MLEVVSRTSKLIQAEFSSWACELQDEWRKVESTEDCLFGSSCVFSTKLVRINGTKNIISQSVRLASLWQPEAVNPQECRQSAVFVPQNSQNLREEA